MEHKRSGTFVVVKMVHHRNHVDRVMLEGEINNHRTITSHRNVVRFLTAFAFPVRNCVAIVMEYVSGSSLFEYVVDRPGGRLDEDLARRLFMQLADGVKFCHSQGMQHGDLSLSNMLLDENLTVKICDFGLSSRMGSGDSFRCGCKEYSAPEVFRKRAWDRAKADVWSWGVMLYAMVTGCFPFGSGKHEVGRILFGQYLVPDKLSVDCKDLIGRMLEMDPARRLGIDAVRNHRWCTININSEQQ